MASTRGIRALRMALAGLGVAVPVAGATSWAATRVLTDAPRHRPARPTVRVRFHSPSSATAHFGRHEPLAEVSGERAALPGHWGLRIPEAYAQIGPPVDERRDEAQVLWTVRPYRTLQGTAPTFEVTGDRRAGRPDRRARDDDPQDPRERRRLRRDRRRQKLPPPWTYDAVMTHYAWPQDPQILARHHGARWEIEAVPSRGGYLPAWRFTPAGPRDTWVIGVHGRGARRAELFRLVSLCLDAHLPCLVVSYRTDEWTSQPARLTTLGTTEWEDVEAAIGLALSRGARRVILAGFSMGGAIVAMTVRRSPFTGAVAGVILDSPALDWGPTLRHVATVRHIPSAMVPVVMLLARARARVDWSALNQVAGASEFRHPILLFHGAADTVTPVWLSDALAEARPDLVTYLRVEDGEHVKLWNVTRTRYERAVHAFLEDVCSSPGSWHDTTAPLAATKATDPGRKGAAADRRRLLPAPIRGAGTRLPAVIPPEPE